MVRLDGAESQHGHWAENFMQVDRHFGTLADYQALSHALHAQGMHLVQDIVLNHTGDCFHYGNRWSASDSALGYTPHDLKRPVPRPRQSPFDRNDPRDPAQRALEVHHWTPDVSDYTDPLQELNAQMSGLDDLNIEHPLVRQVLQRSDGHWIRKVGVDAFRIDRLLRPARLLRRLLARRRRGRTRHRPRGTAHRAAAFPRLRRRLRYRQAR